MINVIKSHEYLRGMEAKECLLRGISTQRTSPVHTVCVWGGGGDMHCC